MTELFQRLWAWLHTHEGRKLFRYLMVSVISTGVSFLVLFLVYGVFRWWTEIPATIFANAAATVPSYWLNRNWAWGKSGRSHLTKEVLPFWLIAAAGIAFSVIGAAVARHLGQTHHLGHTEQTALVLLANVLSFAVFWVIKLLLFNRMFHVPTLIAEIDEHLDVEEHRGTPAAATQSTGAGERPEGAGIR
ncbi:MAG TPA: GtrA family protein [Acidimicrobiales bacterium]|jgi:putative flippase GtrA|nr:GtrA family protein [Acidimicrobiales bacterium]